MASFTETPSRSSYDVVIVGGAIVGSAIAWFIASDPGFDGSVLVVERDPSYGACSTAHTNSCMRQQFSSPLNVLISQFAADYIKNFRSLMDDNPDVPDIDTHNFGYLYLAGDNKFASVLKTNQELQRGLGAGTEILSPQQIGERYPFYNLDDIVCGSLNLIDEGYFDSGVMFEQWRRMARLRGVEYTRGEVVEMIRDGDVVGGVVLHSGITISCGTVVNAAGPRAASVAAMAGIDLPVEPRKRFTFVFEAARSCGHNVPLTIDPSGVHVRSDGTVYMAGCAPDQDDRVSPDDFEMDHEIWENKVWPAIAHRIPAFDQVKLVTRWAGHYAYNPFDHNAIVGPHPEICNFVFANGFSGHGVQQSPAIGRGVAEIVIHGRYTTLDLTPLGYKRIANNQPVTESAVI